MNPWMVVAYALLLIFQAVGTEAAALRYEPSVVELTGTVALEEHFGPPGFGEDPQSDAREVIAVLILDMPVSVEGDPPNVGFNQTSYANVHRIQLVRGHTDPPFSPYAGKHVAVSGTLYEGFTGHHHTDVLISVQSITVR